MKNLIVVGDSFCSWPGLVGIPGGWPQTLADELNLNLICYGGAGDSWWPARTFLLNLPPSVIEDAEFIVFAHTSGDRIPTLNQDIGKVDKSKANTEIEKAVQLYYKHIHDSEFISWAQQQWFIEVSRIWGHKKLCHLHCFPSSLLHINLLQGLNITTNLTALSLNEIGATQFTLFNDNRSNHFSDYNNTQLGLQLATQLKNYSNKSVELEIDKFEQLTNRWFTEL